MRLNLSVVAIVISLVSIVVSLAQPTYNLLISSRTPDLSLEGFHLYDTYAYVYIRNNGSATAHNILVVLSLHTEDLIYQSEISEYIPEIEPNSVSISMLPMGTYQVNSTIPSSLWATHDSIQVLIEVAIESKEVLAHPDNTRFPYNITLVK
jgi:hypothetical protein